MKNFPDKYNHNEIEKKWQGYWRQNSVYKWNEDEPRENNFVIDTPPPSVSGILHMGHISSYTHADFIARYQRMQGKNVFYPMGFDDNGLPTERLVEKEKKVKAHQVGREEFQKLCREVVVEAEKEFENLFNSIALSVDWSQIYQTVSDSSTAISQMSFLDLYEKHAVYRAFEPTIWDPVDCTALSQADLEDKEMPGVMNDIIFTLESGESVMIATTRPELIPACVAIFYHPGDTRYSHLKDSFAITPIFGVQVPILADETVDIEKGTGLVMCCTFGDITDMEWWKKHRLSTRVIINKYGKVELKDKLSEFHNTKLVQEAVEKLDGLKVTEARAAILDILKESGSLIAQKETTKMVKCAERSKAPIEIIITPQWMIKVLDKKKELLEKVSECQWHPSFMRARVENWINGLNWDWCISRQRFFGVPFPVWYSKRRGEEGKILVADKGQLPVNPLVDLPKGYSRDEVIPEVDVMDTWATSSVTPQINSHAINKNLYLNNDDRHQKLFPADIRPQAHEIIRTWAFYTIVKSMYHEDSIPWHNLVISGWVLAADKTKMSKSKGNIVTPVSLIEEKSSDVVRYWAACAKLGYDSVYSEDLFHIGKKLINKLWNAAKFVSIHLSEIDIKKIDLENDVTRKVDRWILSELRETIKNTTKEFDQFEYSVAKAHIEEFFWKNFCDNYLELVKIRIYDAENKDSVGKRSAAVTIAVVFDVLLKLFAPFLPHITEELYDILFCLGHSVHARGNWPDLESLPEDEKAIEFGKNLISVANVIRKFKAEKEISIKTPLDHVVIYDADMYFNGDIMTDLQNMMNINKLELIYSKNDKCLESEDGKFYVEIIL